MKAVVMDLLRQYLRVEVQFQHGKTTSYIAINNEISLET